jgi:CBS domain-containing protein
VLVRELMTPHPRSVTATTSLDDVLDLLASTRVTCLPVVDGPRLLGVVSEADLLAVLVRADPRAHARPVHLAVAGGRAASAVSDVMTSPAWTTEPGADVADVAEQMLEHGWKSVPVVEQDRLVGVISRSDVVRALARPDADVRADLLDLLADQGQPGWEVTVSAGRAVVTGPFGRDESRIARSAASTVVGVREVMVAGEVGSGTNGPVATQVQH